MALALWAAGAASRSHGQAVIPPIELSGSGKLVITTKELMPPIWATESSRLIAREANLTEVDLSGKVIADLTHSAIGKLSLNGQTRADIDEAIIGELRISGNDRAARDLRVNQSLVAVRGSAFSANFVPASATPSVLNLELSDASVEISTTGMSLNTNLGNRSVLKLSAEGAVLSPDSEESVLLNLSQQSRAEVSTTGLDVRADLRDGSVLTLSG